MMTSFTYRMCVRGTVKSVVLHLDHIVIETVTLSHLNKIIDNFLDSSGLINQIM